MMGNPDEKPIHFDHVILSMARGATVQLGWKWHGQRVKNVFEDHHHMVHMGVSIVMGGTPIAGWFMVEKPINMDDEQGYPHQDTSIS